MAINGDGINMMSQLHIFLEVGQYLLRHFYVMGENVQNRRL